MSPYNLAIFIGGIIYVIPYFYSIFSIINFLSSFHCFTILEAFINPLSYIFFKHIQFAFLILQLLNKYIMDQFSLLADSPLQQFSVW